MKFIGDLSCQDALLLERYARKADSILEFGVGGSTQIIAQSLGTKAVFTSIDTDPAWIVRTQDALQKLDVAARCNFTLYENWQPVGQYDLVFDDGADELRASFATQAFQSLSIGGVILFHDTRRYRDVRNVLNLIDRFFEEIDEVRFNEAVDGVSSNITVVRKKKREPYVDWNIAEGRPAWAYGHAPVPEDFWGK